MHVRCIVESKGDIVLDEVGKKLLSWAASMAGDARVDLGPPADDGAGTRVSLYLFDLARAAANRPVQQRVWTFVLHFLVSVDAPAPLDAHRVLASILAAALESPEFDVGDAPPSVELWRALGVRPRPAFTLHVRWQHRKELKQAPPVKQPLAIGEGLLSTLSGIVLGTGDVPIMSASVRIDSLGRSATTDQNGRFRIAGVPRGIDLRLRANAKGVELECAAPGERDDKEDLVIRLPL
jgi:hypothetical protein